MRRIPLLLAILPLILAALAAFDARAGAQDAALADFAGDWSGALAVGGQSLPLVLHVDPDAVPPVTLDSPNQGAFGLPAAESAGEAVTDGALTVSWPAIGARYEGRLSEGGDTLTGTFRQGPAALPLTFERTAGAPAAPVRPQEPVPPLPYDEEAVSIDVPGTEVRLAGTLTMPRGEGPFPGVVLISGSGPQDRDETVLTHRPFLVLSDRLTRAGIAVLRYDDRGVAQSTGAFEGATSRDFAADAAAALRVLDARAETGAVGFVGHSEGGLVASLATVEAGAAPAFTVALAAPFVPMAKIIAQQVEDGLRASGQPEPVVRAAVKTQNAILAAATSDADAAARCAAVEAAAAGLSPAQQAEARAFCGPWMQTILSLDPVALHRRAGVPTLALFGEKDVQVAAEPNAAAARGLENVDVRVVGGANHLFQSADTGAVAEYAQIEETMQEDVMADIATWIADAAR